MTLGDTRSVVRVTTWNVQRAAPDRAVRQMRWVIDAAADVVVLSEVSAGHSGNTMAEVLAEAGYTVHLPVARGDRYRVLLAARSAAIDPVDLAVAVTPHRCVAAEVKLPEAELAVVGLYVPSRGAKTERNLAKRGFQHAVADALPRLSQAVPAAVPTVILGDLNVVEPAHVPHYPVFGDWEYDFYRVFAHHGYTDAYRLLHPAAEQHSWFGRPRKTGQRNGYRFDHAFIDHAHQPSVTECRYDHAPRLSGLSDHAALVLTLRL